MCILCVVQKWSRRVVSMLPWLVIPLIGLWALSQLLPPGLRFEITSPRLACVLVLLGTLFWYEIVLPQLSVYWARRSARIRERQRIQAIELQKLRKTATRRCRNCLTPYRDQNPGGGKFMCSYCGHVSKRPVLDIPGPPESSGIISNLVKKNTWFCSQDYSAESSGNWVTPVPRYWVNIGKEQCLTEQSYSGAAVFTWNLLSSVFSCLRWFCRKVLRLGSYVDDGSLDADHKGLSRKSDNGGNCQESKGEKARRKAEEKRQARLEKEMLEEEERKQREEIARLVEERRKLRDEKMEAEKERLKGLAPDGDRDSRKESEKRRQDRRKDKEKVSSKRSSDGEDPERKTNRETEKKHEFDKKGENEKRDSGKPTTESRKMHMEGVHSVKGVANKYKYFDRIRGTFLSSSRGFQGTTFFGKGSQNPTASLTKSAKPIGGFVDHMQGSGNKRESHAAGHVVGKASSGETKPPGTTYPQPVGTDLLPQTTTLKKSWHQLFTRSSTVSPCPDANAMKRLNHVGQQEVQISQVPDHKVQNDHLHNHLQFGQSLAFTAYPLMNGALAGNPVSPLFADSRFPIGGELDHNFATEEAELFEDPCYVPDPVSLLGPVSESLDDFAGDPGTGFMADYRSEPPHILKNVSDSAEANKPSPIESPMSKLKISMEKHIVSGPCTPKSRDQSASPGGESNNLNEQGTWQMWSSSLCHDGRDLVGGPASWLLPIGQNRNNHEEIMQPPLHNPMVSHAMNDTNILQSAFNHSQTAHVGNHNGGTFSPFTPILGKNDPWLQRSVFHPLPGEGENHFPSLNFHDNAAQCETAYESPKTSAASNPFDQYPASCWSKSDWAVHDGEDLGNSKAVGSHIGGLFSANPDVQSGFLMDVGPGNRSVGSGHNVTDSETVSS